APSLTSAPAALTSAPERPAVFTSASFIVKLANGLSADEQQAVIARDGGTETASVAALRLHTIETSGDTLDQIINNYQSDPLTPIPTATAPGWQASRPPARITIWASPASLTPARASCRSRSWTRLVPARTATSSAVSSGRPTTTPM